MFDKEFYPTPIEVIKKMVEPIKDLNKRFILEPSAGKGDILDYITGKRNIEYSGRTFDVGGVEKKRVYCIEQNEELVYILQEKGYKVLGNDFLNYSTQYCIDLILMNPPFSNGDEHLLHAWNTLDGGDIVCLLNAETINNPYTKTRKLLAKIIEDNGSVEMLGDCFRTAERKTGVNVALVRLHKNSSGEFDFNFTPNEKESIEDFTEEISSGNQMALNDKLGSYIRMYEKSKEAFVKYIKAKSELEFYAAELMGKVGFESTLKNAESVQSKDKREIYNTFVDELKVRSWDQILQKVGIERYMTNNVRNNFNKFKTMQGATDLTRANVMQFVNFICSASGQILNQAVVDVFDIFTKYHKENRCYEEGWKTNSSWKVNKKVILPNFIDSSWGTYYTKNSARWQEYSDIDRAMCYLTGKNYDDFTTQVSGNYTTRENERKYKMESLQHAVSCVKVGDSGVYESEFFKFRCYKKGTLHIWFKDEALWAKFNQVACDGKFSLGDGK